MPKRLLINSFNIKYKMRLDRKRLFVEHAKKARVSEIDNKLTELGRNKEKWE